MRNIINRLISFIKEHDSLIGFGFGLIGIIFGFYSYLSPVETSPVLTVYHQSISDVFKINQPIESLDVFFRGRDIRKDSLNLKIYSLRLINEGDENIREGDYSSDVPFGLKISNGILIKCVPTFSKSKYLLESVRPQIKDSNTVLFQKVIIEKGQYIDFDLLILHQSHIIPQIYPTGKIASIDKINVDQKFDTSEISLWPLILFFIGMPIGLFLFTRVILFLFYIGENYVTKPLRRRKLSRLYGYPYKSLSKVQTLILDVYSSTNKKSFLQAFSTLLDPKKAAQLLLTETEKLKAAQEANNLINQMIKDKLINMQKFKIDYEPDFLKVTTCFIEAGLIQKIDNTSLMFEPDFIIEVRNTVLLLSDQDSEFENDVTIVP